MYQKKVIKWVDFWQREKIIRDIIWKNNMEIFIEASNKILNYHSSDVILDIGSGPCTLVKFLKNRVKEIHCLDISEKYLKICKEKFSQEKNVFFYKLNTNNYTDLSFLNEKKFTKIVCLSVIQYYNTVDEVYNLINEVSRIASAGALFLIADIPMNKGKIYDIFSILKIALKRKFFIDTIKYLIQLKTSEYDKFRSTLGLLIFTDKVLKELIEHLNLNAEILDTKMTTNESRKHLLIKY